MPDTKPKGKNIFGGGNKNSLYVPLTETEQEAISRLVEAKDLKVHVLGWGIVENPRIVFGDMRLGLSFRLNFTAPDPPGIPLYHLDLELRTGSGLLLFKSRESVTYGGNPVMAAAGVYFDMVWDIAIKAIDPNIVKALIPSATGLTSRRQDRDTKEMTLVGNMKLTPKQKRLLHVMQHGENVLKAMKQKP